MSMSDPTDPSSSTDHLTPTPTATVATCSHDGEDGMGSRSLTSGRYEEIRRRLAEGRGIREIAERWVVHAAWYVRSATAGVARRTHADGRSVVDVAARLAGDHSRSGARSSAEVHLGRATPSISPRTRTSGSSSIASSRSTDAASVPRASSSPPSASRSITPAIRSSGYEIKTGEIHKAYVFVSGLGFSQLLFAWAAEDMKSRNWIASHRRMFAYYDGVPHTWKAFHVAAN